MIEFYSTATEYAANELTILRGTSADIVSVWVLLDVNPNVVPTPDQFTQVALVEAPDPLADGDKIDVVTLVGPGDVGLGVAAGDVQPAAGSYQLFVMVVTAAEVVIRSVDEVVIV